MGIYQIPCLTLDSRHERSLESAHARSTESEAIWF